MKEWIISCLVGVSVLIGGIIGVLIFMWVMDYTFPYGFFVVLGVIAAWTATVMTHDHRRSIRRRREAKAAGHDTTTSGGYG
jgi:VIT1/CCC1 family predicted Fe2+/Mn2+ transporter